MLDTQQYVNSQIALYFALYLTFSMGMLGTVLATNLIQFYVFFEANACSVILPNCILWLWCKTKDSSDVLLLDPCWSCSAALGLLAMGFFAGGFDFDTVRANAGNIPEQWLPLIVFALVIGLGVKLAHFCSTFGCRTHMRRLLRLSQHSCLLL